MKNQNVLKTAQGAPPAKNYKECNTFKGEYYEVKAAPLRNEQSNQIGVEMKENIWTDYNNLESKILQLKDMAEVLHQRLSPILANDKNISSLSDSKPENSVQLSAALQRLTNLSFETQFVLQDILDRLYL